MAKRKAAIRTKSSKSARKASAKRRSAKRPNAKRSVKTPARAKRKAPGTGARKLAGPVKKASPSGSRLPPKPHLAVKTKSAARPAVKVPRLERARRILDDSETHQTPPSSLDMDNRGTAARSGRAGMEHTLRDHQGMSPDIAAGDVDVDVQDAYFTGDDSPGGDNSTPDQDIVDDIGKALGVSYDDNEELKGSDKVGERDKHRWELDPASAEDFRDRDKP